MDRRRSDSPYEDRIGYCRLVLDDLYAHVSGTTGLDPSGPDDQPVTGQCALALRRIEAALTGAGLGFADVVRVRYYLPDGRDFEPCWPLLRAAFGATPPAATMVVAGLIDPRMKIEIEVTARRRAP
jgi:enamine deaminase RidA (YjgF/YER057c/UK114 family)